MKRILSLVICLLMLAGAASAEGRLYEYRFADAAEGAELILSNREYYGNMNQIDLNYRLQKLDATLEELEAFAAVQVLDFTDAEKAGIDAAMEKIEQFCAERGYTLPSTDGIAFIKMTMREECDASAYTLGTQIYLGQAFLDYATSDDAESIELFQTVLAHELFHCLTRNHPDFRSDMYGILGFTVEDEDYRFGEDVASRIISNPDVEHHNSHAAFTIGGETRECAVVFVAAPFEKPGDSFFESAQTGLVPIDDLSTLYTSEEAENFWEVFGNNTDYVIDPEETLADNFSLAIMYGPDDAYPTPELIAAIDAYLKDPAGLSAAA